jgi:hypothetical protein
VRWNTVSCSTVSAIVGAIWNPLAPAPTSANRVPVMSTDASHRAEWNDGPRKSSIPAMSGRRGWFSAPTALITNRASSVSIAPSCVRTVTVHRRRASS